MGVCRCHAHAAASHGDSVIVIHDASHDQSLTFSVQVRAIAQVAVAPVVVLSVGATASQPVLLLDSLGRHFATGSDVRLDLAVSVQRTAREQPRCASHWFYRSGACVATATAPRFAFFPRLSSRALSCSLLPSPSLCCALLSCHFMSCHTRSSFQWSPVHCFVISTLVGWCACSTCRRASAPLTPSSFDVFSDDALVVSAVFSDNATVSLVGVSDGDAIVKLWMPASALTYPFPLLE